MSQAVWPGLAAGLAMLAAPGCATQKPQPAHPAAPLPGKEACIYTANLFDWVVLDSSTLIVYAPMSKDAYLLKLFEPIVDLQFRERLGFEGSEHNGQLCKGDYVIARGDWPQRVVIDALRALPPGQDKQLIAAARARSSKPPAPAQP